MFSDSRRMDIIFNYASMFITALCGATFSIIISYFYSAEVLGRFNVVYSYYIVFSQFCVCGLHMAIARFTPEDSESFSFGLLVRTQLICICISSLVSLVFYFFINHVFSGIIAYGVVRSFSAVWVALVLFSVNKVFLGWLNGNSMMKAYAFFQALRNVVIAISLIVSATIGLPGEMLPYCFLISEITIVVLSICFLIANRKVMVIEKPIVSYKDLLWFGVRILPSNAVLELNTKLDVICLSFLIKNEAMIGIYSFAAMFGEGFYQLFVVIRKMINPHITREFTFSRLIEYISELKRDYLKKVYFIYSIGMALVLCGFSVIVKIIGVNNYYKGLCPLTIICLCMVINSKAIVFGNILAQTGYPSEESIVNIATTIGNALLNIILIMRYGIIGAAMATGFSYFIYTVVQRYYVRKRLRFYL